MFNSVNKIKYLARRGMLELDIILTRYIDNCYMKENIFYKTNFVEFLKNEDTNIFDWLFNEITPPEKYKYLVEKLIEEKNKI